MSDLHGSRCHDRLWSADCKPGEPAAWCSCSVRYLHCIHAGLRQLAYVTVGEAAAIGIIGGADGPTAIYVANNLAPDLVAPIAVAAYSYMALIPLIQPPIMKLLTTKKERSIVMKQLRKVSKVREDCIPGIRSTVVLPASSVRSSAAWYADAW